MIADDRFPYWVYGAQQDSGAIAVPSQSIHQNISFMDWRPIDVGGESGYIAPDPNHPGKLFGGNDATYEDLATGWEQNIDAVTAYPDNVWRHLDAADCGLAGGSRAVRDTPASLSLAR